jgi:hypothetical protein
MGLVGGEGVDHGGVEYVAGAEHYIRESRLFYGPRLHVQPVRFGMEHALCATV